MEGRSGDEILVAAEGITVRLRQRRLFAGLTWRIRSGEQWAVLGPNGSGKSSILRALVGLVPTSAGHVHLLLPGGEEKVAYVSFEQQEAVLRREHDRAAFDDFAGRDTGGITVRELVFGGAEPAACTRVVELLDLGPLLDRGLRALSTGEARRALLARALAREPGLLLLDEPFDGLDASGRAVLHDMVRVVVRQGVPTVMATHRTEELLPETSHVMLVRDGSVVCRGTRKEVLGGPHFGELYRKPAEPARPRAPATPPEAGSREPLVEMRAVTVRWGEAVVLQGLDWTMRRGEHWAILGPNGAGKTTLLELIYGDNLQAYANDVRLFGTRRGGGESLWEVRSRVGLVSAALQVRFRTSDTAREVVLSGFSDSVGMYRSPTPDECVLADRWIGRLGLEALAERVYAELSNGERRMVLIARAMVKEPELLILDEPCDGLDPANRSRVLAVVDRVVAGGSTGLLYVSHLDEDLPACLTHVLRLPGRGGRGITGEQSARDGGL